MIIILRPEATEQEIERVEGLARELGLKVHRAQGLGRTTLSLGGSEKDLRAASFEGLPGVKEVRRVTPPYPLAQRRSPGTMVVRIGEVALGGGGVTLIAGPCSVEGREPMISIAESVASHGATMLRGGAFKPRTSPYAFQGLGLEGLKILAAAREKTGLPFVTEVVDTESVSLVEEWADVIQVGARNMQNFSLLQRVGKSSRPALLKRGPSATLDDLLLSAEYILSGGNENVILCERGVRTFADHARNTLDLSILPALRERTHLPVVVDPSHATGRRDFVIPMALAAVAAGADGLMVEVHTDPERALSDGAQSLYPEQFAHLSEETQKLAAALRYDAVSKL
ncbi:MAG: 3-deoxy-7-phosphoheptulonate synthase [Planctomycetota bacterium]|nr:3-deoxy-7-phosphoheptulonate synthase [Planctomycetota bacterium]